MNETIQSSVLGTLSYNAEFHDFEGQADFGGIVTDISVYFASPPEQISEREIIQAQEAYLALVARKPEIEAEIVRQCLPLYNEN